MIDLLRATGADVDQPAPDVVRVDASGELTPEAPYELVARMRASFNVLGPLLGALRARACRAARRRQHRQPQGRHAPARAGGDGRDGRGRARLRRRARRAPARCAHRARVPERRRDREPHVRGGARQGHDRHRERGPRARGHRARHLPQPHGRAPARRGIVDDRDRRRRGAARGRQRDHGRPRRGRDAAHGVRHRGRRDRARRCALRARRDGVDEALRDGHADLADERRPLGARVTRACARSTSPPCPIPVSPPTSCRSRWR